MPNKFIHLHLHSQYSLLDGAIIFERLFKRCKELQMNAVAVTDHGNMFGTIDFYIKAKSAGIKPIIGMEAYIAPAGRFDKKKRSISDVAYHLVLLAQNNTGYQNLLKLASAGYTEGFYYRPRIDKEILSELNEGLICLSGCRKGEIPTQLTQQNEQGAKIAAESFAEIFGPDRFFIELQRHDDGMPDITDELVDLANKMGLGLAATNDVHFLNEDDYQAHNCLCCISINKKSDDPARIVYPKDVFFKSSQQMRQLFSDVPQACDNTLSIAERCNVEIDLDSLHAPVFKTANGSSPEKLLRKLVFDNAIERYGQLNKEVKSRIQRELEAIESRGLSSYFLINWDICRWARENNIPTGARGSAVGTVVGYCLGLCNIDPLKHDLLFERFMDPQRDQIPDIDIDVCQVNRQRVIDYMRDKYGHAAQIITFGTLKARGVIRDVCRVKNVPLSKADKIAKLVPESAGMTLDKALEAEPRLRGIYESDEQIKEVINTCKKLEGLARHASVHAAGFVIADRPLTDFVPLYKAPRCDDIITQYDGDAVEKVGLLKMDFLGSKTLSVLKQTCSLIKEFHDIDINLDKIDTDDGRVFELFQTGQTMGVFQFESAGMQELLIRIQPQCLEDLIAANALYRPGPMALIDDYIERKNGRPWQLPHPVMTELLSETYGIMLYQEQVMRLCSRLGNIPLRQAYTLLKAISKKDAEKIRRIKDKFICGCTDNGLDADRADEIFALIERFAGYGFNKSHATRYSIVAYQTAYLKAYWPAEFMAALLSFETADTGKTAEYIAECSRIGIEVLAPDINESGVDFRPLYNEDNRASILFGLAAIKGIGRKTAEDIVKIRHQAGNFQGLFHFCEHADSRVVNKSAIEKLIKAGAFDKFAGSRAQRTEAVKTAIKYGSTTAADRKKGQLNLFTHNKGSSHIEDDQYLPSIESWPEGKAAAYEKNVLGVYLTNNPLENLSERIEAYATHNTLHLKWCSQDLPIVIGGIITARGFFTVKNGKNAGRQMATCKLEDNSGQVEIVLFPDTLEKYRSYLIEDAVVFVKGSLDRKKGKPCIFADELIDLEQAPQVLGNMENLT